MASQPKPGNKMNRPRKASIPYQPRRMTLPKKHRVHLLGMSLSHLNISISYKNKIKALLANNRALAYALAQAQHELSIKEKEILDLRSKQSLLNIPKQVKSKLCGISQHMDVMVKLLDDALSVCNSEDLASSRNEESRSHSTSEPLCHLPSRNCSSSRESVAPLCEREERWQNNMSVIEEHSMTEAENLPPILFTDDNATKQYKKVLSRSKSRSLAEDISSRPNRDTCNYTNESCCLEKDYQYNSGNSFMDNPIGIGETSHLQRVLSNASNEKGKNIPPCLPVASTVQGRSLEGQNESFDCDIAIQLDPYMLSQAIRGCSPVEVQIQDFSSSCKVEAPIIQKPSLVVGFSADSKTDLAHDNCKIKSHGNVPVELNRTSTILLDMELTGTVSQSAIVSIQPDRTQLKDKSPLKDLSFKDKKRKLRVKKLSQKVSELTQSFLELSQADKSDPDYKPRKSKSKLSRKAKNPTIKSVRKGDNVSFKIFSTSPKSRKRKAPKTTTAKASKKMSKTQEVSVKRDINEHPSAVYDFSFGDSLTRSIVEPYKPSTKLPSPKSKTCDSDKPLKSPLINPEDIREVIENDKHHQKNKLQGKRKSLQQQALKNKESENFDLCKHISPNQRPSRGKVTHKVNSASNKKSSDPDLLKDLGGNAISPLVSRQSSNSCRRHKKKSSEKEENFSDLINKRISGKTPSGKENLPSPRQSTDNIEGRRGSRRQRTPLSYKEPSLNKKIRRE